MSSQPGANSWAVHLDAGVHHLAPLSSLMPCACPAHMLSPLRPGGSLSPMRLGISPYCVSGALPSSHTPNHWDLPLPSGPTHPSPWFPYEPVAPPPPSSSSWPPGPAGPLRRPEGRCQRCQRIRLAASCCPAPQSASGPWRTVGGERDVGESPLSTTGLGHMVNWVPTRTEPSPRVGDFGMRSGLEKGRPPLSSGWGQG